MENMSERLVMLNQKIEILSLGTLRQRIAYSLLKEASRQRADRVTLPYNKRIWAEHLGTARPSLSREIGHMRDQGWISFEGNDFTILDRDALDQLLL
jgi:CRP-like cAMP-binding protein